MNQNTSNSQENTTCYDVLDLAFIYMDLSDTKSLIELLNKYDDSVANTNEGYNELLEIFDKIIDILNGDYRLDYSDETENAREKNANYLISKIDNYFHDSDIIITVFDWFVHELESIINENRADDSDTIFYLNNNNVIDKIKELVRLLKDDFTKNVSRIFSCLNDIEINFDPLFAVINHSYRKLNEINDKNLEEIKKSDKSSGRALIGGAAAAGGLLSLIPVVGIPLAIGAGIGSTKVGDSIAESTHKKYEQEYNSFAIEFKKIIYYDMILLSLYWISDDVLSEILSNVSEEECSLDNNEDTDSFYDDIGLDIDGL